MTRCLSIVILAAAMSASINIAAADQNHSSTKSVGSAVNSSAVSSDHSQGAESTPNLDQSSVGAFVELAQYRVSNACYTPAGSCLISVAAPVGSSCYCVFPGGVIWGVVQ